MPSGGAYFWNQPYPAIRPDVIGRNPDTIEKKRPKMAYF